MRSTPLSAWKLLTSILLFVALASSAAAQSSDPVVTVEIQNLQADGGELETNGTAEFPFTVAVTADNFLCTEDGTIPIALSVTAAEIPPYVTTNLSASELVFTVPRGGHSSSTNSEWSGTQDAKFSVEVGNVTQNATVAFEVKAAFAGTVNGCQSNGSPPAVEATSVTNMSFLSTYVPPPPPPPPAEESFLPGPGALAGTLAAMIGAALRRRPE